jgi:hypothetical protein
MPSRQEDGLGEGDGAPPGELGVPLGEFDGLSEGELLEPPLGEPDGLPLELGLPGELVLG